MPKVKFEKRTERCEFYQRSPSRPNLNNTEKVNNSVETIMPNNTEQPTFTLSINDLIKDALRIHEFRGDGSYALSSFLRDVETILPLLTNNPPAKQYVFQRIIINKIQGPALDVIRTLESNASWEQIRAALVNNFGVKETYHQLYHQVLSARNFQVRDYFNNLRNILAKLNEKFEHDVAKPAEFNQSSNEAIVLRTFLNNIEPNLASIIINRGINNLREAFNLLESLGMIRDKIKTKQNSNQNRNHFNNNNVNRNQNNSFSSNFYNNNNSNNNANNNQNFNSNNRFNGNNNQHFNNRSNNNSNNNYRQNYQQNGQFNHVQLIKRVKDKTIHPDSSDKITIQDNSDVIIVVPYPWK